MIGRAGAPHGMGAGLSDLRTESVRARACGERVLEHARRGCASAWPKPRVGAPALEYRRSSESSWVF